MSKKGERDSMPPPRPPQPSSSSPGVGKKGEWTGFDSGLARLETKEGGKGSVVISRAKLGLPGSLPCWCAHLACHLSKNGKNVGGLLFAMTNV